MPDNVQILTITQLNNNIGSLIRSSHLFGDVYVRGIIKKWSYFRKQDAYYFRIEENPGVGKLEGVIFDQSMMSLSDDIKLDAPVIIHGYIELYNKGGYHRIIASEIEIDNGIAAEEDFETRYARLEKLGYFRQKRPIPKCPKKICVITSPEENGGIVKHDFLSGIENRWPLAEVVLIYSDVATDRAVKSLVEALKIANTTDADVIFFGRGGGDKSIIDKVFNSVELADAILASRIPTVSAVGHEYNYTISDHVADVRARVPSTAAEVLKDKKEVINELDLKKKVLRTSLKAVFDNKIAAVKVLSEKIKGRSPEQRLAAAEKSLDEIADRISRQFERFITAKESEYAAKFLAVKNREHLLLGSKEEAFVHTMSMIEALSPLKVLLRGYSITYSGERIIRSVDEAGTGDKLRIKLPDGFINAVVENTEKE